MRQYLTTRGAKIRVTPMDGISYFFSGTDCGIIDDLSPFYFCVDGELIENEVFFGVYGQIVNGKGTRYDGLLCNLMLRCNPSRDWHLISEAVANFKVGPSVVSRRKNFDVTEQGASSFFYHPDGTELKGFPRFSRYGEAKVIPIR